MSTTATQAAQDMLERLSRAATLFGDGSDAAEPDTAIAQILPGPGEK